MKKLFLLLFFYACSFSLFGQMKVNNQTLFGNEWIVYGQPYYKIKVGSNGIYRISGSILSNNGIDIKNINGSQIQLWHSGKEQPIYVSNSSKLKDTDYIEFYGEKHTLQLDTFLYKNWKKTLLNTEFSLCNDTSVYFLTVVAVGQATKRVKEVAPNYTNVTTPEQFYYMHNEKLFFRNVYYSPTFEGTNKLKYSNFIGIEGFSFGPTTLSSAIIKATDIYPQAARKSSIKVRYGLNQSQNKSELYFNSNLLNTHTVNFKLSVFDSIFTIENTSILENNSFEIKNIGSGEDRNLLSVAEINYPRKYVFENNKSYFLNLFKGKNYFTFSGVNEGSGEDNVIAYCLNSNQRILGGFGSNKNRLLIDIPNDEKVILYSTKSINNVVALSKKIFTKTSNTSFDYLALTSKKFKALPNASNVLKDYLDYRKTVEGGNYKVEEVEVEDIYDQFGWGNENHLQAFKNFNYYLRQNNLKSKYVCIFGKGREYRSWRVTNNPDVDNTTLFIPTYGDYPSDELLFTQGDESYSTFEIGRIAAETAEELDNYLQKIKESENYKSTQTIDDTYWKKRILHLGGGGDKFEQDRINLYLNEMKNQMSLPQYGAEISTFNKTTTDPIDEAIGVKIKRLINSGVSFITFFGHSGVGTWDVNVEDPLKWENKGKYPVIISLGCFSGNVHTQYKGIGEKFLFLKDKGGIAYIASSGSALLDLQGILGKDMYKSLSEEAYGSTLGDLMGLIKEKYKSQNSIGIYTLNQQFTLVGDPAYKLFNNKSPDYTPDGKSIKTVPEVVGSGDKNFDFDIDIYNLGKYLKDSINIRAIFTNLDKNITDTFYYKINAPASKNRISLMIPNKGINALGRNKIFIYVDPNNEVSEGPTPYAENNNEVVSINGEIGYEFYILDNTAKPIYPPNFGIVNKKPMLKVATSNAFANEALYIVQIDTTELFNSPILTSKKITAKGGSFTYDPDISFQNNTVYYWRVSPDSINPDLGFTWQNSSFIYLENSPEGWNQSHFYQYKKNPFNFIYMADDRKFAFSNRIRNIELINGKYVPEFIGYKVDFGNPAGSIRPWQFLDGGIGIAIANPLNGGFINNTGGQYGSINTSAFGSLRSFAFETKTKEDRKKIMDMLNNSIEKGFYVSFFTVYSTTNANLNVEEWANDSLIYGENLFQVLEKKGALQARKLLGAKIKPYSLHFKNDEFAIAEDIGEDFNAVINTKYEFTYAGSSGEHVSVPIGPAKTWKNVLWKHAPLEAKDTISIYVIGIDKNGKESVLVSKSISDNIDISNIDAKLYPFLKLRFNAIDLDKRTVPIIDYWRVVADPLADVEIDPILAFSIPDSVQQGEPINISIGIGNYSSGNFDSLLTKYSLVGKNAEQLYTRIQAFKSGDKKANQFTINSEKLLGEYIFSYEINPEEDQLEANTFNNIGLKKIKVLPDRINPILDVTFDGIKILNEDIVSSKPIIKIELKDENKYLLLNNADNIEITLQYPNLKKVTFDKNSPEFKFFKAENNKPNVAYVELTPTLEDGSYLLIVNGKDASENYSGGINYEVAFKVVTKQSVSNLLNYPNPFSNSTRFVFTITGKVPENIRIQVMTISGKVVKEITESELGPLKIGNNISSYAWDGKDDFGNKLANGVYLYKVIMKNSNNEFIDRYENKSIDKYIENNFGKMVIIR